MNEIEYLKAHQIDQLIEKESQTREYDLIEFLNKNNIPQQGKVNHL